METLPRRWTTAAKSGQECDPLVQAGGVLFQKERDEIPGPAQPSHGIDPGSHPVSDIIRGEPYGVGASFSGECDKKRRCHLFQPQRDDRPVLPHKRDNIGNGSERCQRQSTLVKPSLKSLGKFHGNTDSCKVTERVSFPFRIDHSLGLRELVFGNMMICNDHGHPLLSGLFDRLKSRDGAIHRDHKADPQTMKIPDRLCAQSVPLIHTVRNIPHDIPAHGSDACHKQDSGGHPVHIIIPMDTDLYLVFHGCSDHLHSFLHIRQEKRVMEVFEPGLEILFGTHPVVREPLRDQRRDYRVQLIGRDHMGSDLIRKRSRLPDISHSQNPQAINRRRIKPTLYLNAVEITRPRRVPAPALNPF